MKTTEDVVGVIVAGGGATRLGGGDKGRLEIGGVAMISRIVTSIQPHLAALILNANGDPDRWRDLALPVVADAIRPERGPLAGVLTGLEWTRENFPRARYVLSVPCDTPFLPDDLCPRLAEAIDNGRHAVVCAVAGGWSHPVCALWPVEMASPLRSAMLEEPRLGVGRWMYRHAVAEVAFDEEAFANVNTAEDRKAAEAAIAKRL